MDRSEQPLGGRDRALDSDYSGASSCHAHGGGGAGGACAPARPRRAQVAMPSGHLEMEPGVPGVAQGNREGG